MHNTVLMILSIRDIQSVVDCQNELDCEKVWFKGFKEYELAPYLNKFIAETNFENYFIAPDDLVIKYENFELLKKCLDHQNIVSGWGMYRQNGDYTTIINPNNLQNFITKFAYCNITIGSNILDHSYKINQIHALPDLIETAFTGWFYTGMKRKVWLEYPYQTLNWPWSSSDLMFSKRILSDKKYKQYAVKQAHVVHLSNLNHKSFYDWSSCFNKKEIIKTF